MLITICLNNCGSNKLEKVIVQELAVAEFQKSPKAGVCKGDLKSEKRKFRLFIYQKRLH